MLYLMGVPRKGIGVSSDWLSPSLMSSLRRRFGVHELSMDNGSCAQTVAVRSQYLAKYELKTCADVESVNFQEPLMAR